MSSSEAPATDILAAVEEVFPCTTRMGLVNKLAAIRRELRVIEKKGHNAHFGYDFMRAEDVAGDIGDRLAAANIIVRRANFTVDTQRTEKGAFMVTVMGDYIFVDGDSHEEISNWSAGSGIDNQDKAIFKAQTGALKYALTQGLCLRVGHMDPEEDVKDDAGKQGKPPEKGESFTPPPPNGNAAPPKGIPQRPAQPPPPKFGAADDEFGF